MTIDVIEQVETKPKRKGGRPRVPDEFKRISPRISFRLPLDDRERLLDGPRNRDGLDRTTYMIRALEFYAANRDTWE